MTRQLRDVPPVEPRPAAARPADHPGDHRLVPRPGAGRRPGRAGSSWPTRPPGGCSASARGRRRARAGVAAARAAPASRSPTPSATSGRTCPSRSTRRSSFRLGGEDRAYLPQVRPIRDPDGDTLGAAVVLNDVTRFRLLDQFKSNLVATVSHELKTPLTSVRLAVHLLLEEAVGPLTPEADRAADRRPRQRRAAAGA